MPDPLSYKELQKQAQIYPPLSREEQEYLAVRAAGGDRSAEEKLLRHNARRLLYFLDVFTPGGRGLRWRTWGDSRMRAMHRWREFAPAEITADDILSAAQYALLKAIRTYRPLPPPAMQFNQYVNLLIFREIQHLREKVEKNPRPMPSWGDGDTDREASLIEGRGGAGGERVTARMLFDCYVERFLEPGEALRLGAMLDGREPPDRAWLAGIGAKLRKHIPEEDWHYLASILADGTDDHGPDWMYTR